MTAQTHANASLAGAGHYAVMRLLSEPDLRRLADEARACMRQAGVYRKSELAPDDPDGQGDCWLETAECGPLLEAFIRSPTLADILQRLTGQRWAPRTPMRSSSRYSYTYYREAGQYLGLHRDVVACELSLLTCVDDQPGAGGDLLLYPGRIAERLSDIRATPDVGCLRLRLQPGESLVVFGKEIAHRLTPIGAGRTRIISALCYQRV